MIIEAAVSIGPAILASSLLLLAFGADSIIELLSAGVLYWRLRVEARTAGAETEALEALEQRASRIAAWLLYALTLYVLLQAGYGLLNRHAAERSWWGIG